MMRGAVTEFVVTVLTNLVQLCTQASGLSIAVLSTAKLFSSTCARLWVFNYKNEDFTCTDRQKAVPELNGTEASTAQEVR
jgi:predicted amidohydrolase